MRHEKVGGNAWVWLVGEILKKNGENVKMLHAGVFLNKKNEIQHSILRCDFFSDLKFQF